MKSLATTRLSSKGQVVIPENIRDQMGLHEGDQFVVLSQGDVVILKAIQPPSMDRFDHLIKRARKEAKAANLRPSDVTALIKKVRKDLRK